jgi:metal-dependent amidase/aminoacylase/carboxypeptidase family protein
MGNLREIDPRAEAVTPKLVSWRRDIHHNPELSNWEFLTAKLAAGQLRALRPYLCVHVEP